MRARACSALDVPCLGDSTETGDCKIAECPGIHHINGLSLFISPCCLISPKTINSVTASEWQQWGVWSQCNASCGECIRIRARACSTLDMPCLGDSTETGDCKIAECPGIASFESLHQCLHSVGLVSQYHSNTPSSDIEREWQQWGNWSQCTSSCGEGVRIRARACSVLDGQCLGNSTEAKVCKIAECPGISLCLKDSNVIFQRQRNRPM